MWNFIFILVLILCPFFVNGQINSFSILISNYQSVDQKSDFTVSDSLITIISVYPSYSSSKNFLKERRGIFKNVIKDKCVEYVKYNRTQDLNYYTFCYYRLVKQQGMKIAFIELQIPLPSDMIKFKANPLMALDRTIDYLKGHMDAVVVLLGGKDEETIIPYIPRITENRTVTTVIALPNNGPIKKTSSVLGLSPEEERVGWIRLIKNKNEKGVEVVTCQEINWL